MLPYSPHSLCPLQGREKGGRTLASLLLLLSWFGVHCGSFLCGSFETSLPWMLPKAPLQEEVGLGRRKVRGRSCLDGPTSLFRKRGSLPPIILGLGASTEARKCPVYNSATHSLSLSLSLFWCFLIPFTHFSYPHPHLWHSLYLWACFIVFAFSESIYKCKTIQYWSFSLWCIFLSIRHSRSISPVPNGKISIFIMTE